MEYIRLNACCRVAITRLAPPDAGGPSPPPAARRSDCRRADADARRAEARPHPCHPAVGVPVFANAPYPATSASGPVTGMPTRSLRARGAVAPDDDILVPGQPETADPERFTIERATKAYLDNRAGRNIQTSTLQKYRTMVNQVRAFAETRGYVMLDQLGPTDMDAFYEAWSDGKRSKGKKLERLQGFFEILRQAQDD